MVPMFPGGVEEFIDYQLTNLVEQIVLQYPDDETRALMQQQQTLKDQIRASVTPARLTYDQVAERLATKSAIPA